jgi:hypothetical protein
VTFRTLHRLHYDIETGLSGSRRCIACELLGGSTARERVGEERRFICGGIALSALCKLGPGWCGESFPVCAASRSGIVSAESAAWCPVRVATPAGPSVSEGKPGVGEC